MNWTQTIVSLRKRIVKSRINRNEIRSAILLFQEGMFAAR